MELSVQWYPIYEPTQQMQQAPALLANSHLPSLLPGLEIHWVIQRGPNFSIQ